MQSSSSNVTWRLELATRAMKVGGGGSRHACMHRGVHEVSWAVYQEFTASRGQIKGEEYRVYKVIV